MTAGEIHKFPHDPVLVKLLMAARLTQDTKPIIHDALGFEKSYADLFSDILAMRELLRARLPPSAIYERGLLHEKNQYIAILTKSGYEFLVAFFSIRTVGGVCMPLGSGILPEEAQYFLSEANAICMLAGRGSMERADSIRTYIHEHGIPNEFLVLPISCDAQDSKNPEIMIDDSCLMDPNGPGLVVFSSGTTRHPKGAVLPRRCFSGAQPMEPGAVALNYRPGHWIGGAGSLIRPVLSGKQLQILEVKSRDARADAVLEAFRTHQITHAAFSPDLLRRMMDMMTGQSGQLSQDQREKWSHSFKYLSALSCSAGLLESSTRKFWADLTGLPFDNIYSTTELGGAAIRGRSGIQGSIGTPLPAVKVKLSEGDRGELCVKSPNMLIQYIGDKDATLNAFDDEGYFKTGDLANLKDGEYIFAGRANADYVQYGIFRIPTLLVETNLMDLPYISEACIVAVPDKNFKHLCGAVVRLKPIGIPPTEQINLSLIRSDLEDSLATCMLPALLRILTDEEELPCTATGKLIKKEILKIYFGSTDGAQVDSYPPGIERCELPKPGEQMAKPWDWGGLQCED